MAQQSLDSLERAKQGDPVAFQELVRPHIPKLRRLAYTYCRNWDEADDVAQDSLLKAYRSFHTYEARSAISTWLYSVTRSVCNDWYRRKRSSRATDTTELSPEQSDTADTQEYLLEQKSEVERLWQAIHTLPEEFRVPLVLSDVEGLAYEEIARMESIPIGTVRSRLSRARRKLSDLFEPDDGSPQIPPTESGVTAGSSMRRSDPGRAV